MPKEVGPFAIVKDQRNALTIEKHGIYNKVSTVRATLAPGCKPPNKASQHFAVEEDPLEDHNASRQDTRAEPTEYNVEQIVSYEQLAHINVQKMRFASEFAGTGIHQSVTL